MNEANCRRTASHAVRLLVACTLGALALALCHVPQAVAQQTFSGTTMGPVPYNVTVSELPADVPADELEELIRVELEDVNQRMSTYIPDSEVSLFNRSTSTEWFDVSSATAVVVARALELSKATDGAFDITVAPLVNLWSFGPEVQPSDLPDEAAIKSALEKVGFQHLEARLSPPAIRKSIPELSIDLSAIAKGYAVDRVAGALSAKGVEAYMVEVGGEVRTAGQSPRKLAWVIGIESPTPDRRRVEHRVELNQKSLATSGDYRNFFVVDGVRYSHTIDPRTGRSVEHNLTSVSVVADDCMTADALATAMMVVGPERVQELATQLQVEVLWMQPSADSDRFATSTTNDFPLLAEVQDARARASLWPMFAAGFLVFVVALLGMSVGVIFSNRRIKGSCGGLAALKNGDGKSPCEICESRSNCDEFQNALAKHEATVD